jgi:hypothetical protein
MVGDGQGAPLATVVALGLLVATIGIPLLMLCWMCDDPLVIFVAGALLPAGNVIGIAYVFHHAPLGDGQYGLNFFLFPLPIGSLLSAGGMSWASRRARRREPSTPRITRP